MRYEFTAISDEEIPQASEPLFQHLLTTYTSETNKTASIWRAVPDRKIEARHFSEGNLEGLAKINAE